MCQKSFKHNDVKLKWEIIFDAALKIIFLNPQYLDRDLVKIKKQQILKWK